MRSPTTCGHSTSTRRSPSSTRPATRSTPRNRRLDKEGKQITLRLAWPGAPEEATAAALIVDWFAQLGIKVNAAPEDEAKLGAELLPPEADPPGKANFDMFIWDWVGDPDPTSLLKVLTTKEIGASSDSLWSNARYDELYDKQLAETDDTARHAEVAEMQQIMYDEAPYHILYYPSQLDANRTDQFGGWRNQPSQNGNPLFGFGPLDYTYLTDANAPAAIARRPSAARLGVAGIVGGGRRDHARAGRVGGTGHDGHGFELDAVAPARDHRAGRDRRGRSSSVIRRRREAAEEE